MATTKKDLQFVISATNLSQKPLTDVADAISKVNRGLQEQVAASKAGEASSEELASSLNTLKQATDGLLRQQSLVDRYRALAEQVDKTRQKVIDTAAAYDKATASGEKTEAQLAKLAAANTRAQTAQGKANDQLAKQVEILQKNGIAVENLGQAQNQIVTSIDAAVQATIQLREAQDTNARSQRERTQAIRDENAAIKAQAQAENEAKDALKRANAEIAAAEAERLRDEEDAAKREQANIRATNNALKEQADAEERTRLALKRMHDEIAADNAIQEKAQAELAAFRALADQVNATARGYQTLGNQASRLTLSGARTTSASAAVAGTVNPTAARVSTAAGVGAEVNEVAASVQAIRGPLKDYDGLVTRLRASLKALGEQAGAVDGLSKQQAAVAAAQSAYEAIDAELKRVQASVRAANEPNAQLAAELRAVQQAAAAAGTTLEKETQTLAEMSAAAKRAGIDTDNLEREEQRLVDTAKQATGAMGQLNSAHAKYGEAVDNSSKRSGLFQVGERQSLGLVQRIRGELLGLAAAYIGVQAAIGLAGGALDAYVAKQTVQNRLAIVVGNDQHKIADEYDYIHAQADRLGIGLNDLADNYSRFGIAAKNGGLNMEETHYIFERLSEAMRVNGASTDAISGAWFQFEQMLSKGKVQMEDLRQASNWIPGLEGELAKGLGAINPKMFGGLSSEVEKMASAGDKAKVLPMLMQAMKKGAVDARVAMLALAEQMQRDYAERLPAALKTLQAEQGRFATQLDLFKQQIATSGFAEAYATMLGKITEFMKGEEGANVAQGISDILTGLVDLVTKYGPSVIAAFKDIAGALGQMWDIAKAAFGWLDVLPDGVKNVDLLRIAIDTLVGIKAAQFFIGTAAGVGEMAGNLVIATLRLKEFTVALATTNVGATATAGGIGRIGQVIAVVSAGLAGWEIGTILREKFEAVRVVADQIIGAIMELSIQSQYAIQIGGTQMLNGVVHAIQATLIALKSFGNDVADIEAKILRKLGHDELAGQVTNLFGDTDKMKKDLADRSAAEDKYLNDLRSKRDAALKQHLSVVADMVAADRKADDLTNKPFADVTGSAETSKGVDATGKPVNYSNIDGAGGDADKAAAAAERLAKKREALESQLAEQLRGIDEKIAKHQDDSIEQRLSAVDLQYQRLYEKLAKLQKLGGKSVTVKDENGDDKTYSIEQYKAQLESMKEVLKAQETEAYNKETLKKLEDDLNEATAERAARLKEINDLLSSGAITTGDAYARTSKVLDELNPKIAKAADKATEFANAARGKGITDNQADAITAKGDQAVDSKVSNAAILDTVGAGEKRINDILQQRKDIVDANNHLVELGLETNREAQAKIEQTNNELGPKIREQADALLVVLDEMKQTGDISGHDYDLQTAKIRGMRGESQQLSAAMTAARDTIVNGLGEGASRAIDSLGQGIAGVLHGTESWHDALGNLWDTMKQFFADFLKQLALAIIKQQILNLVQSQQKNSAGGGGTGGGGSSSGSWIQTAIQVVAAAYAHTGAEVTVGGGSGGVRRDVPMHLFENAPRYHQGSGMALAPDERAAILQTGEEVLARDDDRNVLNKNRKHGGSGAAPVQLQQTLLLDPNEIHNVTTSSRGQQATMTNIKANIGTLRQWLNK